MATGQLSEKEVEKLVVDCQLVRTVVALVLLYQLFELIAGYEIDYL